MKSQTALVAEDIRLKQWALQIQSCQNRPADMDVKTWCAQNNITRANYYYRMRKVRQACLQMVQKEQPTEFVEIPTEALRSETSVFSDTHEVAATITLPNGLRIELSNTANASFIHSLLGAASHVE